jgi:dihydrofolate synthase/folylpolyglutamate synthase
MTFDQALVYLDSLALFGIKAGLDHTRRLAEAMGSPQRTFPSVLVAGTNGKGSTSAFLERILRQSGRRVGLFTSPHLVDVRERIMVSGEPIPPEALAEAVTRVREASEALQGEGELEGPPTYFECLTLAALHHFRDRNVDLAVLEVGMGGRLDCTNVVEPILSVVTTIGLDHQQWLGSDVASIAREKAGIFRRGVPALTGEARSPAAAVLEAEGRRIGAAFEGPEGTIIDGDGSWLFSLGDVRFHLPHPPMPGRHQLENAALAVRCALRLDRSGWAIPESAIAGGIGCAAWPGRLERVATGPDVYVDGAHNPDACEVLAAFIGGLARAPKALVFTAMRDKDLASMARALGPKFDGVWVTTLPMARCAAPADLKAAFGGDAGKVEVVLDSEEALAEARRWVGADGVVVAAGSLYLAGRLKAALSGAPARSWGTGL